MKILITGANGYIGQGVVAKLLNLQYEIIATDIILDKVDNRAKKIQADIFHLDNPYEDLGKPDIVLHLAWRNGFIHNSDTHILDLPKHYLFIKKMILSGIKQIGILGTMHEIGFYEGSIDEKTPTNPQNKYGIVKNALRELIELLAKEHKVVYQWIRGYYIIKNTSEGSSIFSKIVQAEQQNKLLFPFNTGMNQYDFIEYDEFCRQLSNIITQTEITGIINACSGYPQRLGEVVENFIKRNNYKIKLDYGVFPERIYDSKAVWGDNKKIKQIEERKKNV